MRRDETDIRAALRRVVDGLPRLIGPDEINMPPVPADDRNRDPGLPDLGRDAGFLRAGGDGRLLQKAIHEAGHAMVAHGLGLEVESIERSVPESLGDGARRTMYGCNIGGPVDADWAVVDAAGMLSEVLVWGRDAYWAGAFDDLIKMARKDKADRLGPVRHAVARGWRATRLPPPASLDLSVTMDDLIVARDRIPDRALDAAILALPDTLRVAAAVFEAWDRGEMVVPREAILGALEDTPVAAVP